MKFLLVALLLVFTSSNVFPEETGKKPEKANTVNPDDELFYNVSFGASAFDCMLGIEIQKGNHSVGLSGSVK